MRNKKWWQFPAVAAMAVAAAMSVSAPEGKAQSATERQAAGVSVERARALEEMNSQLRIGAEYFLNRTATKESVEKSFRVMHENGITLVRIFVIWDDLERTPGKWDFTGYDWIYDAAAKNGIKIAATLCSEDPPGWKKRTPFYHHYTNLDVAENRADAEVYLEKVVGRYKHHPGQGAWLLMNEPNKYDADAATFAVFGKWLEKKYGTTEELNKKWFTPLENFSGASISDAELKAYWNDPQAYVDWKEFNVENLIDVLLWIRGKVLTIDPNHPTHFNVTEPTGDADGQDVWKEKGVPDILGVSMHAAWAFPATTPENEYGERYAYRLDLIGNASKSDPGKPFWVTELQAGPTVFTGKFPLNVTPAMLSKWIWDSYGAGSKAAVFWLWSPRDYGEEGGEWGLVGQNDAATPRLAAVKSIAETLKKDTVLARTHTQQARVAILYNREAVVVNAYDGRTQNRQEEVVEALFGCYLALLRAHVPTQFVDIDQLKNGEVNKFAVLYAPDSYALDDAGVAAMQAYVKQGGVLWADGLTAWKTETTLVRPTIPGGMTELFGVESSDIYPVQAEHPYSVTSGEERGGELWRLPLELKGAEVLLRDREGKPFAVKHTFGKGTAYFYEAGVSLAYARRGNAVVQKWIVGPAAGSGNRLPVALENGSEKVIFRGLVGDRGMAAVLSNWGDAGSVVVSFGGEHTLKNAMTGASVAGTVKNGRTVATVKLESGESVVVEAE